MASRCFRRCSRRDPLGHHAAGAEGGVYELELWNPRDFTSDNYRTVDDRPYGGGPGMVMLAEPLEQAIRARASGRRVRAAGAR